MLSAVKRTEIHQNQSDRCRSEDVEMLEDMILTAVNDAMKQIDELTEKEMAKVTGGMKLPGMF